MLRLETCGNREESFKNQMNLALSKNRIQLIANYLSIQHQFYTIKTTCIVFANSSLISLSCPFTLTLKLVGFFCKTVME